jgi:hypothetical protein
VGTPPGTFVAIDTFGELASAADVAVVVTVPVESWIGEVAYMLPVGVRASLRRVSVAAAAPMFAGVASCASVTPPLETLTMLQFVAVTVVVLVAVGVIESGTSRVA